MRYVFGERRNCGSRAPTRQRGQSIARFGGSKTDKNHHAKPVRRDGPLDLRYRMRRWQFLHRVHDRRTATRPRTRPGRGREVHSRAHAGRTRPRRAIRVEVGGHVPRVRDQTALAGGEGATGRDRGMSIVGRSVWDSRYRLLFSRFTPCVRD